MSATRRRRLSNTETGDITGTKNKDYNIIWFTGVCLSNALRMETYFQDAEREGDSELAEFFRRAQKESRKRRTGQAAAGLTFATLIPMCGVPGPTGCCPPELWAGFDRGRLPEGQGWPS